LPVNVIEYGPLVPEDSDIVKIKNEAHVSSLEDSGQLALVERYDFAEEFSLWS
jgi:hypothetical protein